jgi:nudix-type nucleoside diphosphatase (YffH/AdpP family)
VSDDHDFETLESVDHYKGRSIVRSERVRMPDGGEAEREIVVHDDAVAVVPVTDDGQVVLLRQYRQPFRRHVLEIPAGTLDHEGESIEQAANRELAEEAGYAAQRLEHLATFYNSAGWTDEQTHVYLGHGAHRTDVPTGFEAEHEEADMEVVHLELAEALDLARRGEIKDSKTLIGLLLTAERS